MSAVEKVLYHESPAAVANIVSAGALARQMTEQLYGDGYPDANNADAYRHTFWGYSSAVAGKEIARLFTNAHEYMTWTNFMAGRPLLETRMDLYNNMAGINAWFDKNFWGMPINRPEDLVDKGMTVRIDTEKNILIPTDSSGKKDS